MSYFITPEKFLDDLKRAATAEKKANRAGPLVYYQDCIVKPAGFQSWAVFHRRIIQDGLDGLEDRRLAIVSNLHRTLPKTAHNYALRNIERYFRSNFERCEEFSAPNKQTANGYSHPSVSVGEEVRKAFGGIYPESYLVQAIEHLDELGPWCESDSEITLEHPGLVDFD